MGHRWLVALVALALVNGCRTQEPPPQVPDDLLGVWKTEDERYADRYIELRPTAVVLGMGEGTSETHPIRAVAVDLEREGTLYRVTYRNAREGIEDVLAFFHYRGSGGVIRLKNQREITWRKEGR